MEEFCYKGKKYELEAINNHIQSIKDKYGEIGLTDYNELVMKENFLNSATIVKKTQKKWSELFVIPDKRSYKLDEIEKVIEMVKKMYGDLPRREYNKLSRSFNWPCATVVVKVTQKKWSEIFPDGTRNKRPNTTRISGDELIGKKIGRLRVIKEVERYGKYARQFLCKCSCGNETIVRMNCLRGANPTKSCGCLIDEAKRKRKKNIAGERFGKLTAIEVVGQDEKTNYIWKCKCDCGNTIEASVAQLNYYRSCGCARKEAISTLSKVKKERYGMVPDALAQNKTFKRPNPNGTGIFNYHGRDGVKYVATIGINNKTIHLGTFEYLKEAQAARRQAELRFTEHVHRKYQKEKNVKKNYTKEELQIVVKSLQKDFPSLTIKTYTQIAKKRGYPSSATLLKTLGCKSWNELFLRSHKKDVEFWANETKRRFRKNEVSEIEYIVKRDRLGLPSEQIFKSDSHKWSDWFGRSNERSERVYSRWEIKHLVREIKQEFGYLSIKEYEKIAYIRNMPTAATIMRYMQTKKWSRIFEK